MTLTFFWLFYKFKKDQGQFFGFYKPWLHEHEHEHFHYEDSSEEGDTMPILAEGHDENEHDHDEGDHEEDE